MDSFFFFFCMRYTCLCILFSTYCNKHKCSVAFATAIVEIIMLSRLHAAVIVFLVSIHTQPNRILSMKDLIWDEEKCLALIKSLDLTNLFICSLVKSETISHFMNFLQVAIPSCVGFLLCWQLHPFILCLHFHSQHFCLCIFHNSLCLSLTSWKNKNKQESAFTKACRHIHVHILNNIITLKENQPPSDGQKASLAELFM